MGCTGNGRRVGLEQLRVLCWKNFLLQKNQGWKSLIVFVVPVLLMSLLLLMRRATPSVPITSPTIFSNFTIAGFQRAVWEPDPRLSLAYAPNTTLAARIMRGAVHMLNVSNLQVLGMETEKNLEEELSKDDAIFGGIVFFFGNADHLPKRITYKIRLRGVWKTDSMYPTTPTSGPRGNSNFGGYIPGYYHNDFLHLQRALDLAIIHEVSEEFDSNSVELQLKQYPYPQYVDDPFIDVTLGILSLFILCCFSVVFDAICRDVILEKERKLKELIRLMGVRNSVYWFSWFCKFFIYAMVVLIVLTSILHSKFSGDAILNYTSPSVTFVLLLLYSLAVISFAFAISTFFSKASTGSTFGSIVFLIAYCPRIFMNNNMSQMKKMAAMLDLNLAMAFGCDRILQYERMGVGMQWSSITKPYGPDDNSSMLHVFVMLVVDFVLYGILTWYLDKVLPNEVGTVKPFYFPLMKSYWFGDSSNATNERDEKDFLTADNEECFEKPADNATVGIRIRGLTKVFAKKGNVAVSNLNLDFYEGNITALVGHNGAGKSTTIFMLMGYLPPTEGKICINGLDIRNNMDKIRGNIGFCPQYDALFDNLTVKEHLIFFAKIKGCFAERAEMEVMDLMNALQLTEKMNTLSKSLSGGMKRKLCVGNALIGDSKFIVLDEPTSGLDPSTRRLIWDILRNQQKDRTMILSTHFMDEADLLGDRIAIMANGQAKCYGTPMFLKNKYGIGYHLTLVKQSECDVGKLKTVIQTCVDNSEMESNVGTEVAFILPQECSHKFETLFETLEEQQGSLGIESFGVSVTTMEDVFFRVGHDGDGNLVKKHQTFDEVSVHRGTSVSGIELSKEPSCVRRFLQFQGMFDKRVLCSARNYWIAFVQLSIPIFTTVIACLSIFRNSFTGKIDFPPMYLNLSHFATPVVPLEILQTTTDVNVASNLSVCYSRTVSTGGGSIAKLSELQDDLTMDNYLLEIAHRSLSNYNLKYLIGATVETVPDETFKARIIGWFNNEAYHSIAISLSYVTNALMQCFGRPEYHIETINHPLPEILVKELDGDLSLDIVVTPLTLSVLISFGLGILISTFAVFIVSERVTGAKRIQLVSSATVFNFWFGTFVWDLINFMIPSAVIIIILACFQVPVYTDGTVIWYVLLDFVFYGISIIPCVYVVSFLFRVPSTAQAFISCIIMLTSLVSVTTVIALSSIPSQRHTGKILEWVFYALLPNFCFEQALRDLYRNFESHRICRQFFGSMDQEAYCQQASNSTHCCPGNCDPFCFVPRSYYAWEFPGIGRSLVFLILQSVFFFVIIGIIESIRTTIDCIPAQRQLKKKNVISEDKIELGSDVLLARDSDVLDERERVLNEVVSEPIVIKDLTKIFVDFVAVDQLCLGVQRGECFGLLGVNGAGKTTCFRMLMGDLLPTFGDALIGGHSVVKQRGKVYQLVGYCPQFDAHIPQMTVRETLSMIACFRGITKNNRNRVVDGLIDRLMLKENANKLTCTLSGGNQRKLSIAVAIIGDPPIIFLDEPTTGMDPATRRVIWDVLATLRDNGHTLVLTSHHMEECEALCTRVAIMVNGRFYCLGSIQQLKAKFSEGFSIIIKTQSSGLDAEAKVQQVQAFMKSAFPGSILKDHHQGLLNYQVYNPSLKWSYIFRSMENAKCQLMIEDYSVSQTTLEQLFLSFARMQRESQQLKRSWRDNLRGLLKSIRS